MDNPLVSIVIPIYNPPEDKFCACMDSVLAQSYDKIEIILVDDGSMAECAAVVDTWAQRDVRVQVVHQPNGGVGNARNRGVELAHGKYISFVDADDCVVNSWLSRAVLEAEKENADIVYGCVYMTKSRPERSDKNEDRQICSQTYKGGKLWRIQEMLLLNNKNPLPGLPYLDFGTCGKLFRTEIVKQTLFPTNLPITEDQVFNHALLIKCQQVVITNIPAYYYISNMDSATHKSRPDVVYDMLRALNQMKDFLFDRPEVINAYYYRLISEIMVGIRISYFYQGDEHYSFLEKYKEIKKIFLNKEVDNAVRKVRLDINVERIKKIKIKFLKYHVYIPFVWIWTLKKMR